MTRRNHLIPLAALALSACQTGTAMTPAMLETADESTLARIKAVLAEAVGRAYVQLGESDLTTGSTVTVLPPPLGPNETHSPAMPAVFELVTNGSDCFLVRQKTGESYALDGVSCVAVEGQ